MIKTNAMRMLECETISYHTAEYVFDESHSLGQDAAKAIGMAPEQVFKTLVARGDKTGVIVFCIPVNEVLDLKKAAVASNNKSVEMIPVKELLSLTGYVRGGCSPIGMKKRYAAFIDETAALYDEIAVSAGIRGKQIILSPEKLIHFIEAKICDIIK